MSQDQVSAALLDYSSLVRSLGGFETAMKNPRASKQLQDEYGAQVRYLREKGIPEAIKRLVDSLGKGVNLERSLNEFASGPHSLFGEKG